MRVCLFILCLFISFSIMEEEMKVSEAELPSSFTNIIVKYDDGVCEIRSSVNSPTDISRWIEEFSHSTKTSWNLRKSRPKETGKLLSSQTYACHHSKYGKSSKSRKNYDCRAYILCSIKLTTASTRRRDKFVKDGLPAKIKISCKHSHALKTPAALSFLKPDNNVRISFEKYFQNGLNVSEAIKFHEVSLEVDGNFEETLANANLNPKTRTVQHWCDEWRKLNSGIRTGPGICEDQDPSSIRDVAIQETPTTIPIDSTPMDDEASEEDMGQIIEAMKKCHEKFGTSQSALETFSNALGMITTRNDWELFLSILACSPKGEIEVQPTAISCRRAGATRRSQLKAGRSPMSSVLKRKKNGVRNLSQNIEKNEDNAQSH